ncbi:hypothetical protein INR49_016805, partial [Caranx melampygus]
MHKVKVNNGCSYLRSNSKRVYVDAVCQIGHALHLCLLLRPQRLLPQTEEEEKGASGGRGGLDCSAQLTVLTTDCLMFCDEDTVT